MEGLNPIIADVCQHADKASCGFQLRVAGERTPQHGVDPLWPMSPLRTNIAFQLTDLDYAQAGVSKSHEEAITSSRRFTGGDKSLPHKLGLGPW
jgi:hypothetical protein